MLRMHLIIYSDLKKSTSIKRLPLYEVTLSETVQNHITKSILSFLAEHNETQFAKFAQSQELYPQQHNALLVFVENEVQSMLGEMHLPDRARSLVYELTSQQYQTSIQEGLCSHIEQKLERESRQKLNQIQDTTRVSIVAVFHEAAIHF